MEVNEGPDMADKDNSTLDYEKIKKEREQYFKDLQTWLDSARLWENVSAGFPYYYAGIGPNACEQHRDMQQNFEAYAQSLMRGQQMQQRFTPNNIRQRNSAPTRNAAAAQIRNPVPFYQIYPFTLPFNVAQPPSTYEFVIPPLWKRLVAEFLDFMILFSLKLALTFVLMESFSFLNIDFIGLDTLQKNMDNPEIAYPMAVELLTLELLHRLIVCAYETYFLRGKLCATPGKRYMGLMVVTVDSLTSVPNREVETISVTGARSLGWQKSLARASLKNLLVGLLLPLCVAFYIFPHNRTSYDMMSNSVVVESHREFLVYNSVANN